MTHTPYFNETYYLQQNADVLLAVARGIFTSGHQHYELFGGRELRNPSVDLNVNHYLTSNPDVLAAISSGTFASPLDHFVRFGAAENRAPISTLAGFDAARYLTANADVQAAVTAGVFKSAIDHFLQFGTTEARPAFTKSGETIGTTTPGTTFTLTTNVDALTGTANNDTFSGVVSTTTGSTTLGAGDTVDGKGGTDTLNIIFDGASPSYSPVATISNIEVLNLKNAATGTATMNMTGISGVQQVWNDASQKAVNVTGLGALATLGIKNSDQAFDVTYTNAALAGSADVQTVELAGASTGASLTIGATSGSEGVETVTINSGGVAANTLSSILSDQNDFTTLNLTGNQALTLLAVDSTLTTIDASKMTAALTANVSAATTAGDVKVVGTALNDTITTAATTKADTIDGGAGTDTVVATGSFGATLTNVENLTLRAAAGTSTPSADMDNAQSVTTINVDGITNGGQFNKVNFTNLAANSTINLSSNGTSAIDQASTITLKTATGTSDAVTINLSGNGAFNFSANSVTVTGIETINLGSTASGTVTLNKANLFDDGGTSTTKIVLTGSSLFDINATLTDNTGGELDGSALTGVLDMAGSAFNGGGASTIKGGSNNDILLGAAGADTIIGGAGNDTITGAGGDDTLTGGAGADTFVFSASTANGKDTITDFQGASDKLNVIAMTAGTGVAADAITSAAAAINTADRKDFVQIVSTDGTAASITTGGTKALAEADLTAGTLTNVAAFIAEKFTGNSSTDGADTGVYIINHTASGSTKSYVYQWDNDTAANVTQAAELVLVGIVTRDAVLANTDLIVAA